MLLMYVAVIFTMTVVTAVIFMWMNKRYAEMLYKETTDSLFLISNEMKLYLDSIEADSYYMVADAALQSICLLIRVQRMAGKNVSCVTR